MIIMLLMKLAFERCLQACPTLSNLTKLVLGDWCMAADFYPLFRILHRCPKLNELTVKLQMVIHAYASRPNMYV